MEHIPVSSIHWSNKWPSGMDQCSPLPKLCQCYEMVNKKIPTIHKEARGFDSSCNLQWESHILDIEAYETGAFKVQATTCLSLDQILEPFDIDVNKTGCSLKQTLSPSWLKSHVHTITNTCVAKQWSAIKRIRPMNGNHSWIIKRVPWCKTSKWNNSSSILKYLGEFLSSIYAIRNLNHIVNKRSNSEHLMIWKASSS